MATRWAVTTAVRMSDLPPPARLIVFVLADLADNDTAMVPEARSLSLTELARQTGLGRSTVARMLNLLEDSGWVKRDQPGYSQARAGEKTKYQLKVGGSPTAGLVPERDYLSSPTEGLGLVPERDGGSPSAGRKRKNPSTTPQEPSKPFLSAASRRRGEAAPARLDVEQICRHLADRIEGNGSKRPGITENWRKAARLLLDKDARTVEQVIKAIDWCQTDDFWRSNILSMQKLREKYEQLRLAAQRGQNASSPRSTGVNRFVNNDRPDSNPFAGGANAIVASQVTGAAQ